MRERLAPAALRGGRRYLGSIGRVLRGALAVGESALDAVIGDEEERGARRGADDGRADATVDATEAARGDEALAGLQARLERVEREEREVDSGAGNGSGLRDESQKASGRGH